MRIMAIYPGATITGFASFKKGGSNEATYINHGLAMISAVLKRDSHKIWLLDLRAFKDWKQFEEEITRQNFDMALITFMSVDENYAKKCLEIVKKYHPNKPTVAGGIHLSVTQAKSFPNADCVILGEGEEAIIDFVKTYEKTGKIKPLYESNPIANLDSLPWVDRDIFNNQFELETPLLPLLPTPFVTIIFSRGCAYRCKFCFPSRQLIAGKKKRCRSPQDCVNELWSLRTSSGVGSIMIHDDLFPEKIDWLEKFIDSFGTILPRIPFWLQMRSDFICKYPEIIKELARIGLTWVSLGLESGNQRILDFLRKGVTVEQNIEACEILHRNYVNIFGNFILGLPGETKEDVEATGKLLERTKPEWHSGSVYTSYPGSDLYEYIKENNLWEDGHYSQIRYPYERKIKGVDYNYIFSKLGEFGQYKSKLKEYPLPIKINIPERKESKLKINPQQKKLNPKVSIIMTSHNRPYFLEEAIQSVLDQTIPNWQLIIVDSSSNEKVEEILSEAQKDSRIIVLKEPFNIDGEGNISLAWNKGLDMAEGEYIALLDDDNKKKPNFCEVMSKYLDENKNVDALACLSEFINIKGEVVPTAYRSHSGLSKESILAGNFVDSGEMMVRKEVFEKVGYFDERLTTYDDWDMVIRIIYESKGFGLIEDKLARYRIHNDQRIQRTLALNPKNEELMRKKKKRYGTKLKVSCISPDPERLTRSQNQVCQSIKDTLADIPFVETKEMGTISSYSPSVLRESDIVLVPAPFEIKIPEMKKLASYEIPIVNIHMEDPQAFLANLERDRFAEWVITNDLATPLLRRQQDDSN